MNRDEFYIALNNNSEELTHYGTLGQKWGIRRWQNEDGSLTEAGAARYAKLSRRNERLVRKVNRTQPKLDRTSERLPKAQRMKARAERLRERANRLEARSARVENSVDKYKARIDRYMAKIRRNDRKMSSFNPAHIANGQAALNAMMREIKES